MTFWRLLSCCCIFCENRSLLYQTGFALSMNPVDGELSEKTTNVTEWAKCLTICAALCSARGGKSRRCLSAGGHACMTTIEYLQQPGMPCRKFNRRYRENVLRFLHTTIGIRGREPMARTVGAGHQDREAHDTFLLPLCGEDIA